MPVLVTSIFLTKWVFEISTLREYLNYSMRDCMGSACHTVVPSFHPLPTCGLQLSPDAWSPSILCASKPPNGAFLQGPFLQSPPKVRSSAFCVMCLSGFLHCGKYLRKSPHKEDRVIQAPGFSSLVALDCLASLFHHVLTAQYMMVKHVTKEACSPHGSLLVKAEEKPGLQRLLQRHRQCPSFLPLILTVQWFYHLPLVPQASTRLLA